MKPAGSIVFFTVASGAGFGVLFWLGLLRPLGLAPGGAWFGASVCAVALALAGAGLLSSLAHLGHPERAWRALSQWRSSWLSREGVAAIATYVPGGLFFLAMLAGLEGVASLCGLLAALCAAVTVYCTGMIYASLPTIRQWSHPMVVPGYLLFSAFSGAALLAAFAAFADGVAAPALIGAALAAAGFVWKRAYWHAIDRAPRVAATAETATGLGFIGRVRPFEAPHTETNYLLREMGFRIARVHAAKLRRIALAAGFAAPAVLLLAGAMLPAAAAPLLAIAALLALAGLLAERWLMFAEATHTVTLYYRGNA